VYLSTSISDTSASSATTPWKSEHVFLGRSYAKSCYRVSNLHLLSLPAPSDEGCLVLFELSVQAVTASQCKALVEECPSVRIRFTS
jgi:hypothetical protein